MVAVFIGLLFSVGAFAAEPARPAKKVILMISDGCGYNHILATDYYQYGEAGKQCYEQFPVKYGVSTHSADGFAYDPARAWKEWGFVKGGTDSAAAATAMAAGCKTRNTYLGLNARKERVENLVERAKRIGMSAGVVTTVPLSHATPAGFVAHSEDRGKYEEIGREMILYSAADVIMGCGHPDYNNDGERVAPGKENYQYVGGRETWEAISRRGMTPVSPWTLVQTRKEFQDLIQGPPPKRVLGVAQSRDATQERRRGDPKAEPGQVPFIESVPTLKEMSVGALNVLNQNPKGFFLMIEGGAVDWAAHSNLSGRMIEEQMDFNLAADAVVEWVERNGGWDDALVIVTADHETGWLWGPGSGPNTDPMWKPLVNNGAGRMPGMQWCSTGHTNTLVPLYAKGAGADLFAAHVLPAPDPVRGAYVDNTSIALAIMQAMPPH